MNDEQPLSILLAVRPPRATPAGISDLRGLLDAAGVDVVSLSPQGEYTSQDARWEAEVTARLVDEATRTYRVWLEPAPRDLIEQMLATDIAWRGVLAEDRETAVAATWAMGVGTAFAQRPLWDFHAQLKLLRAVAPDAVFVLDTNAFAPRPGAWLHEIAASIAPPSFESLYTIHCVGERDKPVWLHTHGLDRCGCIELDMVDVPADFAGLAGQMLNVVSAMFIERGVPDADEPFLAGHELELVWLPWEQAVDKVAGGLPGGRDDRDDLVHRGARGVLFAPKKGLLGRKYLSPAVHREVLEGNPLLYMSNMATARAALLAKERLPRFRALFEQHGGAREHFMFLLKLGYPVDGADNGLDREHLWFDVHALHDDRVEATLLNQPYAVAALSEGQRGEHRLDKLSDWAIMCVYGRFEPDTIGELERLIDEVPLERLLADEGSSRA